MNIEELKLILATVEGVSGSAMWVVSTFIFKYYFSTIIFASVWLYVVKIIFNLLKPLVVQVGFSARVRNLLEIEGDHMSEEEMTYALGLLKKGLKHE